MLSGKAVARAIRGHILVTAALHTKLTQEAFGLSNIQSDEFNSSYSEEDVAPATDHTIETTAVLPSDLLHSAADLYDDAISGKISVDSLENSEVLHDISKKIEAEKKAMHNRRTARLWLQYLDMVQILLTFIKAERTGN